MKRGLIKIIVVIDTAEDTTDKVKNIIKTGAVAEGCSIAEMTIKKDSVGADFAYSIVKS